MVKTQDTTIFDETGANALDVDASGRATVNQGLAASLSGKWPVQITDGTNTMPTADAVARAIFSKITDGTSVVTVTGNRLDVNAALAWNDANKIHVWNGTTELAIDASGFLTVKQGTSPWVTSNNNGAGAAAVNIQDGGNSITIDGSISNTAFGVNNGAGASAVNIQDGGNSITVDGTFWPATQPVSGTVAVTQSTSPWVTSNNNGAGAAAVNIQDGGNSITVDGTVAFSNTTIAVTQATAASLNATVVQPTGTNLHVVTDSQTPGTGATNLGKAEDAAHTSGDVGVMALAVRNDAGTALAGATGDYIPLSTDSVGNLRVNISSISGAGNSTQWQAAVAAGKAFLLTSDLITVSGTAAVPFFLLRNPVASGKTIKIKKISYNLIASITSDSGIYRVYRDCTITTNGTAKTPVKMVKSQANSAVLLSGTAPTVSANGTLLFNNATTSGGSFNIIDDDLTWYIEQGENIYFTLQPAVTGKQHGINIWFIEE